MVGGKIVVTCLFMGLVQAVRADAILDERLVKAIEKVFPGTSVTSVSSGPLAGLHEVILGPSVLYISEDGRFLVRGDVFDLSSLENVTKSRRAQARVDAFLEMGVENMIEFAPKHSQAIRHLYVYTDIDCGYCRKMHLEIEQLNDAGIAVRYLAYPRAGIGSESYDKAVSVWCSSNPQKALTVAKSGNTIEPLSCENPVTKHYRMGEAMGLRGTPAVYLDDGNQIGGYVPAKELIKKLITNRS
ncbi:MAG TPA: disulfide bond formation protein DsbC [Gammaproteobacteria bacterium]|nr:disulfide bond formation protein DsbC [Gammaproteobacteria bacterium]|tara:strand:- start:6585 stop:7313 length:729 start_codon:yes stop_codon:yes gene_type:complete